MSKWIRTSFCCALTALALFAHGCGQAEPEATAAPKPVIKYPTAQSLIDEYNRLAAAQPPNVKAMTALYKAENPEQREWLDFMNAAIPIYELSVEMERQFGEGFDRNTSAFEIGAGGSATILEHQGQRAEAEHKEPSGDKTRLYLVQLDGCWWLSGYTFEYHPEMQKVTPEERTNALAGINLITGVADGVLSRLRAGEFESAKDTRQALAAAAAQKAIEAAGRSSGGGTAFGTQ